MASPTKVASFHSRVAEHRRIELGKGSDKAKQEAFPNNYVSTTKYKLWNIVPLNLFEQFHRVANLWFLVVSIFQMLPLDISPTNKFATIVPLCCVLLVTFFKDAFEDYKRWADDKRVNNQVCEVLKDSSFVRTRWRDVAVGKYLRLYRDEAAPADFLLLYSSQESGIAFVDTAQLDGETSLKAKNPPQESLHMVRTIELQDIEGHLDVELPNAMVSNFTGVLHLKGLPRGVPLDLKNLILRGSTLRNTDWVLGLVVYTGLDTKIVQNSNRSVSLKRSQVEVTANWLLFIIFFILLAIALVSTILNATLFNSGSRGESENRWVWPDIDPSKENPFLSFLTFLIGYNNLIPISLYMTTDLVRALQATLMERDQSMYHKATQTFCQVRSSGLCEDLGQVEFIMSDKTGTLTQNIMCFKACYVDGQTYGCWEDSEEPSEYPIMTSSSNTNDALNYRDLGRPSNHIVRIPHSSVCLPLKPELWAALETSKLHASWCSISEMESEDSLLNQFFLCLATCHTAIPEKIGDRSKARSSMAAKRPASRKESSPHRFADSSLEAIEDPFLEGLPFEAQAKRREMVAEASTTVYRSSSPDEEALVAMARDHGFFLRSRVGNQLTVNIRGQDRTYTVVMCNEFSSDRKRMSVLIRQSEETNNSGSALDNGGSVHSQGSSSSPLVPAGVPSVGELPVFIGSCYILFAKGADNVMMERLSSEDGNSDQRRLRSLLEQSQSSLGEELSDSDLDESLDGSFVPPENGRYLNPGSASQGEDQEGQNDEVSDEEEAEELTPSHEQLQHKGEEDEKQALGTDRADGLQNDDLTESNAFSEVAAAGNIPSLSVEKPNCVSAIAKAMENTNNANSMNSSRNISTLAQALQPTAGMTSGAAVQNAQIATKNLAFSAVKPNATPPGQPPAPTSQAPALLMVPDEAGVPKNLSNNVQPQVIGASALGVCEAVGVPSIDLLKDASGQVGGIAESGSATGSHETQAALSSRQRAKLQLKNFTRHGLRTLVCAVKHLSDWEADEIMGRMRTAKGSFINREAMEQEVMDSIEKDLELLGITAVEDKIQDGVPETVTMLLQGGIKVWMLTGDNMETAKTTALACRLFDHSTKEFALDEDVQSAPAALHLLRTFQEEITTRLADDALFQYCLVVHGQALYTIMEGKSDRLREMFVMIACSSRSVIACRLSPSQKAAIVELVRNSLVGNPLTLAIGDGGNDVSMIQKAHVGVGVLGAEGREAANAADFAIGQFRFLRSLLFMHGRWNVRRIGLVIGYCFYKNFFLVVPMVCYAPSAGFSGTTFYDSYLLMLYNLVFTSLPIFILGVLDVDVFASASLSVPALYFLGVKRKYFNWRMLSAWVLRGIVHAFLNYATAVMVFGLAASQSGFTADYLAIGSWSYWSVVLVANVTLLVHAEVWMDWQIIIGVLSVVGLIPCLLIHSTPYVSTILNPGMIGVAEYWLSCVSSWLATLLLLAVSILPELLMSSWQRHRNPDLVRRIQAHQRKSQDDSGHEVHPFHSPMPMPQVDTVLSLNSLLQECYTWQQVLVNYVPKPSSDEQLINVGSPPDAEQQELLYALAPVMSLEKRREIRLRKGRHLHSSRSSPAFAHQESRTSDLSFSNPESFWRRLRTCQFRELLADMYEWQWQDMDKLGAALVENKKQSRNTDEHVSDYGRVLAGAMAAAADAAKKGNAVAPGRVAEVNNELATSLKSEFAYSWVTLRFRSNLHERTFSKKFGAEAAYQFKTSVRVLSAIVVFFQAARLITFAFRGVWTAEAITSAVALGAAALGAELIRLPLTYKCVRFPEYYMLGVTLCLLVTIHVYSIIAGISVVIAATYTPLFLAVGVRIKFLQLFSILFLNMVSFFFRFRFGSLQGTGTCSGGTSYICESGRLTLEYIVCQASVTLIFVGYAYVLERFARESFALDVSIQATRQKDIELLRGMFPEEVVSHVMRDFRERHAAANAKKITTQYKMSPICRDRGVVTIMFCDICDFEKLVDALRPAELVKLLDVAFMTFDHVCEESGVTKIETVGKTFMAAGMTNDSVNSQPTPEQIREDAIHTLLAAVKIIRKALVSGIGVEGTSQIAVRIGIHTGPVISGVVGSQKPQFALFGDTVNTASRMQSTGVVNHIHISSTTYAEVGMDRRFTWQERQIEAKGKGKMTTYLLVSRLRGRDLEISSRRMSSRMLQTPTLNTLGNVAGSNVDSSAMSVSWLENSNLDLGVVGTPMVHFEPRMKAIASANGDEDHLQALLKEESDRELPPSERLTVRIWNALTWIDQDLVSSGQTLPTLLNILAFLAFHASVSICLIFSKKWKDGTFPDVFAALRTFYAFVLILLSGAVARRHFASSSSSSPDGSNRSGQESPGILAKSESFKTYFMTKNNSLIDKASPLQASTPASLSPHEDRTTVTTSSDKSSYTLLALLVLLGYICSVVSDILGLMRSDFTAIGFWIYFETMFFTCIMLHLCMLRITLAAVASSVVLLAVAIVLAAAVVGEASTYALYPVAIYVVQLCVIYSTKTYQVRSFTTLALIRQEHEEVDRLMSNLLPLEILVEMKTDCLSLAYHYNDMTLLFADIVGFTKYCSMHTATEAVTLVTKLFAEFDNWTLQLGVYKVCTIGDAYVAVNEPTFQNVDKVMSCRQVMSLAQGMLHVIAKVRQEVKHDGLDMRIGVHHGNFVAGVIGTNRLRFDMWGEDVLLGNSVESNGLPGHISVSQKVKDLLEGLPQYQFIPHRDIVLTHGGVTKTYLLET